MWQLFCKADHNMKQRCLGTMETQLKHALGFTLSVPIGWCFRKKNIRITVSDPLFLLFLCWASIASKQQKTKCIAQPTRLSRDANLLTSCFAWQEYMSSRHTWKERWWRLVLLPCMWSSVHRRVAITLPMHENIETLALTTAISLCMGGRLNLM